MFRLLKGFGVTLNYLTKKNITVQYPEEKVVMPERFRGIHRFFPEKCIVCNLCVQACPTDVISLTGKKSEENPKKKVIETYNIDFQGCILCDFCTEVCPTDAIVMTARYDNLSEYNRSAHFKDMEWLTNNHVYGNYTEEPEERNPKQKPEASSSTKPVKSSAASLEKKDDHRERGTTDIKGTEAEDVKNREAVSTPKPKKTNLSKEPSHGDHSKDGTGRGDHV
ncbi:NADH-quinone oxidoreductase subunit I [Salipaludibacillus agaradhaerens]|nr:NADH-quinone oxidoreductase subunit I [Salipaludibacillus agaradhaerens]MCR6120243.1 NADH-quinone oxidoreductase subunit I [Salipaludibacillus agaradhaerens]UJW59264.1 NADH-quinone oxidoreductase subunit I [Bacillus sp. A116_S68]